MIRRRRRGGSVVFASALILATGAAFATGSRLRARLPEQTRIAPATQLAQAGQTGSRRQFPVTPGKNRNGRDARNGAAAAAAAPVEDEAAVIGARGTFEIVYNLVQEHFVDKLPSDGEMSQGAIRAMLDSLNDPNSFFLKPEQRALYDAEAEGDFAGIGAGLFVRPIKRDGYTEHKIVVVAPLPGSPAQKAGLKSGDLITHIDGKWVLGANPFLRANKLYKQVLARDADENEYRKEYEAAQSRFKGGIKLLEAQMLLRQGENETRVLTVQRPGVTAPMRVEMTTGTTKVKPMTARTLPGGIGYIKINAFTDDLDAEFADALASLPVQQPGLVLDLRGNPGGSLEPARAIAGMLTGGTGGSFLVEVGVNGKRTPLSLPAPGKGKSRPQQARPVIVLVDRGTASTAEALAAALLDKGVGTLVGGRTFGDGVAQTLYPMEDGSAFTLTTGKLVGPKGTDWQTAGLMPRVALASGMSEEQVIARAVIELKHRAQIAAAPAAAARKKP